MIRTAKYLAAAALVFFLALLPVLALAQVDAPITFTVYAMEAMLAYRCQDEMQAQRQKWLVDQLPFPPFGEGSEDIKITETVIRAVCPILAAQVGDGYSFEELVWLAATESEAWFKVQAWFDELSDATEVRDLGEPSGASTPKA